MRLNAIGKSRLARGGAFLAALPAMLLAGGAALAHTGEGGFVLLLPVGYYLIGGTAAVAASFLLIALVPGDRLRRLADASLPLFSLRDGNRMRIARSLANTLATLLLILLLLIGYFGNTDPLDNLLPLSIWTLWWVALVVLQAMLGDVWSWLNPWVVPAALLGRLLARDETSPLWRYPEWLGYWPASAAFFAFAWFELVYPAPADPTRLAEAAACYSLWTILGMACFGAEAWLGRAEPFSIFFGLIARLSPLVTTQDVMTQDVTTQDEAGLRRCRLAWPGAGLLSAAPLPVSGVIFILLVLAAVTFDGLGSTFWWLGIGGVNPLEFPGRSAVIGFMTLGLLGSWVVLAGLYFGAVWLGGRLARAANGGQARLSTAAAAGALVISIMPISIAYHIAHYLTDFLVNIQDVWVAISDPFERDWDLFGTGSYHVTSAMLSDYQSVRLIWNIEAVVIVLGHLLAVALAHLIGRRLWGGGRAALSREAPLAVLMIFYTLFGLWLLATPHAG